LRAPRAFMVAGATLGVTLLALISTQPAAAAVSYTASGLTATVSGSTVTSKVTVTSSTTTTVRVVGVCVRDSAGRNVDYTHDYDRSISSSGTALSKTKTFGAGTYSYWTCLYDGTWRQLGATKTFTVGSISSVAPSGTAMPRGDLTGWRQVFSDDFTSNVARGSFPGPYKPSWMSYNGFTDTSKHGDYNQGIISAQDGKLDLYLHSINGRPQGAAPVPLVNGKWGGQTYGRFSVRMRADALKGYGTGFLLWPDSDNAREGEIDFPESGLNDVVKAYNHCLGVLGQNCLVATSTKRYTDWHTYTVDWTPKKLTFLIDGVVLASTTTNIPSKPLHWVMQTATTASGPSTSTSGHLQIDWAVIYAYNP